MMSGSPEPKNERNWSIWREYRAGGVRLVEVGAKHGVTIGRVRQIVLRCDQQVKYSLRKMFRPSFKPLEDHIRDGLLGIEFTFMDDLALTYEDRCSGQWQQLDNETWFKINIGASDE